MKVTKQLTLLIITSMTLILSSCSSEESMLTNEVPTNKLLKSFTVKKDANGAYSLNFDLNSDAVVDKTYNDYSKTSQFVLYSSNKPGVRNVKEPMSINDSKIQIGFVDTNTDEKPSITIVDDNITFGKGDTEALQSFEISSVDDSAYQLDFTVKDDITAKFVYNEDLDTYEVHLDGGKSDTSSYTVMFDKEEGKKLRIDFLNYNENEESKARAVQAIRKPKIIIDD